MSSNKNKLQEYTQKNVLPMPKYNTIRLPSKDHGVRWKSSVIFTMTDEKKYRANGNPSSTKINTEQSAAQKALNYISLTKSELNSTNRSRAAVLKGELRLSAPTSELHLRESLRSGPIKAYTLESNLLDSKEDKFDDLHKQPSNLPPLPSNKILSNTIPEERNSLESHERNSSKKVDYHSSERAGFETAPKFKPKTTNKTLIIIDVENVHKALDDILSRVSKSKNIDILCFISEDHYMKTKLNLSDHRVRLIEAPTSRSDGADIGIVMYIGFLLAREAYQRYFIISKDHFADAAVDCIYKFDEMVGNVGFQREAYACKNVNKLVTILQRLD